VKDRAYCLGDTLVVNVTTNLRARFALGVAGSCETQSSPVDRDETLNATLPGYWFLARIVHFLPDLRVFAIRYFVTRSLRGSVSVKTTHGQRSPEKYSKTKRKTST
jgi:hypothetical protein